MLAKDWNDPDQEAPDPRPFQPAREPGPPFPDGFRPVQEASFCFFTPAVVAAITTFTNEYAWMHIPEKSPMTTSLEHGLRIEGLLQIYIIAPWKLGTSYHS